MLVYSSKLIDTIIFRNVPPHGTRVTYLNVMVPFIMSSVNFFPVPFLVQLESAAGVTLEEVNT